MFGECHAHMLMDGESYKDAVQRHKYGVCEEIIHRNFQEYNRRQVKFIRDGGDALGVSKKAKELAVQYGIDYRTPVFAIHKNGYYGGIVGKGFDTLQEYHALVKEAGRQGADFIKIMTTGIMDFDHAGVLTSSKLECTLVKEMIHIAHEEGFAVMAHTNGKQAVEEAAQCGVDSIEHGNFIDEESLMIMKEHGTVYVPTVVTIKNLLGCGRFPDQEVGQNMDMAKAAITMAYEKRVLTALGSDAGAYKVYHGFGICEEYETFHQILGMEPEVDQWLRHGEEVIRRKFRRMS